MNWWNNKIKFFMIFFVTSLFIAALGINAIAQNKDITDQDITMAIEADLLFDNAISSHLIDVTTTQGIVTLSGSVNTLLAKDRALKIAQSIKGVRSIINQITVKQVERKDSEIKADVETALLWDPATDSYKVNVSVNNGVVTLTGKVESWAEKQLSEQVTKSVRGIKDIKNNIEIVYAAKRSDLEIKPEIESRLESDPYVDEALINVVVNSGKVTLNGTVGSVNEKIQAYNNAWVAGVLAVDSSGLEIKSWAKNEMKQKILTPKTDAQIEKIIKDTYLYDPRVYSFQIDAKSDYGVVTLSGVVDNYKAKKAAEQDAKNTKGVVTVYNNIKVRSENPPTDTEIAERIRRAFLWDPVIDRHEITTLVRNQKAYLYGDVDSFYEKQRAEDIASRIGGVADIQNSLTVLTTRPWRSDQRIKNDIKNQLFWSWFVDSDAISVEVADGVATLTGTANSWHEVYSAVANAFEGGASIVKSRLKVNGSEDYFPIYHYQNYYDLPDGNWIFQYSSN